MRIVATGANRGLGPGLCRACLGAGHSVVATARQPDAATELRERDITVVALHPATGELYEPRLRALRPTQL